MTPAGAITMLFVLLIAAAPVHGQQSDRATGFDDRSRALIRPALEPGLTPGNGGFSFRIDEPQEPDGSWSLRRGIVAGVEVAPDATVGIGLFETMPKRIPRSEESALDRPKRSRKAAVGMTWKF